VNIPAPARSDDLETLLALIGLGWRLERSRKQLWHKDRTRNRHRWTGWAYQGAWGNHAEGTRQITRV